MGEGAPIYLTSGAYQASDVIANAQRCVNLYLEKNPEDTKPGAPTTHYMKPGKSVPIAAPVPGNGRMLARASNGLLYAVVGSTVYMVDAGLAFHALGNIGAGTSIVSMADNGSSLTGGGNSIVLVDGTANGYVINMATFALTPLVDGTGLFTGADIVQILETFFLFNKRQTQDWYISLANSVSFNALDIAAKAAYPDSIVTIGLRQREVWLIGTVTTEPWSLTGAADFPFESIPSTYVAYGCIAVYSMIQADAGLFWLSQNQQGERMFVVSKGYAADRVSNHGIEQLLTKMATVSDCVGSSFQIEGHTFLVWSFPTEDITLVFDIATKQWSQWAWTDDDGVLHRDRSIIYAHAYGRIFGLDWETGALYTVDTNLVTDDGDRAMTCIRGWPHILKSMNRVTHWALTADMSCGQIEDQDRDPQLNMRYSDDRGRSFTEFGSTSLGKAGEYLVSPQFRNLGMARDRVYELYWAEKMKTALNGAYLDAEEAES